MLTNILKASKVFVTATAFSLLIACPVFAAVSGYANGTNINVRAQASTSAEVLGKLDVKDGVGIVGENGEFFQINYKDTSAYVHKDFITIESVEGRIFEDEADITNHDTSEVYGKAGLGATFKFTAKHGSLLLTEYEGKAAFINNDYIDADFEEYLKDVDVEKLPQEYVMVTCEGSLNMRSDASTESEVVTKLYKGSAVDLVEKTSGEWIKVQTGDGTQGYVNTEFVEVKFGVKPALSSGASGDGEALVAYAKQWVGTPYVYGGTSLGSGVDCSGFTYSVYKNFGITLNRTSRSQPSNGVPVSRSELRAGDLMFFTNYGAGNIQHVGIYCGDGTFIHAASGNQMQVTIDGIDESYYASNYITACRVLQ